MLKNKQGNVMFHELAKSVRPRQWYKNLVVFTALIFSLGIFNVSMLSRTLLTFAIFCLVSGSAYIFNDIHDMEKDRKHPKKKLRPIASGKIGIRTAGIFGILILAVALPLSLILLNIAVFVIVVAYFVLIDLYTYWLKRFAIVDIMVISVGFVLRAVAGVAAIMAKLSPWLILCTLLLAMLLALGKRKHEMIIMRAKSTRHRQSLSYYSMNMIDNFITVSASLIIISYSLYTFLATSIWMMLTIPFVIFAVLRYMQLLSLKEIGEEAEMIFKDVSMLVDMALWLIVTLLVLYDIPPLLLSQVIAL